MSSVKRLKAFLEMFVSWHPRGYVALVGEAPLFVLGDWLDDMASQWGASIRSRNVAACL